MEGIDWDALAKAEQKAKTTEVIHVIGEKEKPRRSERVRPDKELQTAVRNAKENSLSNVYATPTPHRDQELPNQTIRSNMDRDTICVILNQYQKKK